MLWAFQSARVGLKTLQKIGPCSGVQSGVKDSYIQCQVCRPFVCRTVTSLRPSHVGVVFCRIVSFQSLGLEGDGQAIKLAPCCRRRTERELSGFGVIPAVGHEDLKPMRRRKLIMEISSRPGKLGRSRGEVLVSNWKFDSIAILMMCHKTPLQLF